MTIELTARARPWFLVGLALALVALLSGCSLPVATASAGGAILGARAEGPPGLGARNVRTTGRVLAPVLPAFNADSLEVSGTWQVPPAADQYGPIQGLRVCALGGAINPPADIGQPSASDCRLLPGNTQAAVIRLPFDLSGMGDLTGSVWKVRLCVTTIRHNRDGPQVCADDEFPLDAPAPDPVTGLTVTSRVVAGGNE